MYSYSQIAESHETRTEQLIVNDNFDLVHKGIQVNKRIGDDSLSQHLQKHNKAVVNVTSIFPVGNRERRRRYLAIQMFLRLSPQSRTTNKHADITGLSIAYACKYLVAYRVDLTVSSRDQAIANRRAHCPHRTSDSYLSLERTIDTTTATYSSMVR